MLHKVLIIDDNHSFIDSLTVILKEYSFQYDSAFRFQEAAQKIAKNGSLVQRSVSNELLSFEEKVKEFEAKVDALNKKRNNGEEDEPTDEELVAPEVPQVSDALINETGYSLIIVEQDTETSLKGINFVKNVMRTDPHWSENDFIILSGRPHQIEAEAKQAGLVVLEKPVKQAALRQLVNKRIKIKEALLERAQFLLDNLGNQQQHLKNILASSVKPVEPAEKKPSTRNKLLSKFSNKNEATEESVPAADQEKPKKAAGTGSKARPKKSPQKKVTSKKKTTKKAVKKTKAKAPAKKAPAKATTTKKAAKKKASKKAAPAKKKTGAAKTATTAKKAKKKAGKSKTTKRK